jgi:hypothetical protein
MIILNEYMRGRRTIRQPVAIGAAVAVGVRALGLAALGVGLLFDDRWAVAIKTRLKGLVA